MGVNYTQYCIYGFKIENCKKVLKEAVYEEQPRYNTKTGKQTHTEKVLVKEEEYIYEALDCQGINLDDLPEAIALKYHTEFLPSLIDIYIDYEQEDIYVGFYLGNETDYNRVCLLEGEVDKLPDPLSPFLDKEWKIYFVTNIG